jgi:hypothetical protein
MIARWKIALVGVVALLGGSGAVAGATTTLQMSWADAFAILGHSCGGIQEQVLVTGFDAISGDPAGDVYLQTRCGGSGRGGGYHTTTYARWVGVTWDFTGAVVGWNVLPSAPGGLDPALSVVDGAGNRLDNVLVATNVAPDACSVGNTTYCAYRASLTLAPDFVPPPRITGISVATGPASGGTSVVITGTGFTGATDVRFGGVAATGFTVDGDTSITATSPPTTAGTVDVAVVNAGGASAPGDADLFTFVAAPVLAAISPDRGPVTGGTAVTIGGSGFADAIEVDFGDTAAAFVVNDDASITATAPAIEQPDTVRVRVVTVGGTTAATRADVFTYEAVVGGGCGGSCPASVQCAHVRGFVGGALVLARCTPMSAGSKHGDVSADLGVITWRESGETTLLDVVPSSPGQGVCRAGSIELDLAGSTVAGGTSAYVPAGEALSAQLCVSPTGKVKPVKRTTFAF